LLEKQRRKELGKEERWDGGVEGKREVIVATMLGRARKKQVT